MLPFDTFLAQELTIQTLHDGRDQRRQAVRAALGLYRQARLRGQLRGVMSRITGRVDHILDLDAIQATPGCELPGVRSVPVASIHGSERRCRDFDCEFNPHPGLQKDRWLRIATARKLGTPLPPVELLQVGEVYFVRDGHHRVSVARAMGEQTVDAVVAVWQVSEPVSGGRRPRPSMRHLKHWRRLECTVVAAASSRQVAVWP